MTKKSLLLGMAMLALIQHGANASILADPGFEAATAPGNPAYAYNPSDPGAWTFSGNSGYVTAGSIFNNPNPTGTKAAFLQFNPNQGAPGSISQVFVAGGGATPVQYVLTFDTARRTLNPQSQFSVTIDNNVFTITPGDTFATVTLNFTLTGTNHLITFTALNSAAFQDTTSFIDNVNLNYAVPEPGSLTLLGLGAVSALGVAARRRRTA